MKKALLLMLVLSSGWFLSACEETIDEGPDNINITLEGLKGLGSLESPYLMSINVGETVMKYLEVEGVYETLELLQGQIVSGKFKSDLSLEALTIKQDQDDSVLLITANQKGEYMVRIKGKDMSSSAYIQVEVTDPASYKERLRILAIGNSFSEDATTYLGEIASNLGVEEVIIGNLYIGGASLETHWNSIKNRTSSYTYYKYSNNQWENKGAKSLVVGLLDEPWDIISMQQVSGLSGIEESLQPYLDDILDYVNETKLTESTFVWHQTWAYAQNSNHSDFPRYEKDQTLMYQSIMDVSQNYILKHDAFTRIIPAGTAIQNLRNTEIGDNLTRDGYHLNVYGRYVAGLMWFKSLTGLSIDELTYRPQNVTEQQMNLAIEAVNQAYQTKFQISN
ncbi:hypothetical protein BN85300570 [Paracholeplasma brassicae]|uniref:DUF4886 domain-containing protein n=1 Tax=Acholeplasma brassicae TaxID=61635 RepID=U4KQS2_9MOLU|nr:DUF4886 domain-containing protein [Paracholeplasma brassicae]CCV65078.1 hypothetical protein BN85300570 [Paracholeplasma brassicae]